LTSWIALTGGLVTAEIAGNEFVGAPVGNYLFGIALILPLAINGGTLAIAVALVASIPAVLKTNAAARSRATRQQSRIRVGLHWLRQHRSFWPVP